ncbi:hypothetical protein Ae168Ps1_3146 [Pseudonocardia sp. Ae168_Ps1]|nr:hypothetical protein Ae150APs1_3132 [Pseudonocardia sp. Ae150A_Ps1]OLL80736.1 hypothetical protein Ae168Ps1_3142 [Pseudonocardia sp. Ae168_Ps1]OLL80740.1 hypothetical protein Ae168Ps1_3146 [Pseudonocardia sp. Ae168_Ps1]OLL85136.1 hypothetical protein Ae263Ps1_2191c [Pseudonocardia sp. Ae263_Ps1]OLL94838.1 hypothetical protein Ae356Ps1_4735 [Pseudonocardia sp. Ae356_Ps1]
MSEDTERTTGTSGRTTRSALLGAMFLMATSAIGPGFITQTTQFTAQLGAAFAFAILVSILVDIAIQMNVWRIVGVSGMRAHELANRVAPGAGWVLTALVVVGGLVFNIANCLAPGLMEGVKPGDDEQRWQPHGSTPTSCGNERSGWSSTPRPTLSTPARTSAAVSVTSWESFRKPCAAG